MISIQSSEFANGILVSVCRDGEPYFNKTFEDTDEALQYTAWLKRLFRALDLALVA